MKVISIIQPWASLIVLGEKKFETRSWNTQHRGEIAIHASKKIDKSVCREEPFRSILAKHGYTESNLPIGVILATGKLLDCFKVIEDKGLSATLNVGITVSGNEYAFGDFSEGRFAWEIADVQALVEPIPAKGQLGLWNYSLHDN
jgi:hypothetical protein